VPWSPGARPEGEILAERAAVLSVPRSQILVTNRVANTAEEGRAVAWQLQGLPSTTANAQIILVTSALHMRRSRALFARAGFQVVPFPVNFHVEDIGNRVDLLVYCSPFRARQGHAWQHGRGESDMPTVHVPAQLSVEHLMTAVKQLSPAELRTFARQFAAWQGQKSQQAAEEAALLADIEENSRLPVAAQRRYERLRRQCERQMLTARALAEYQSLLQQLEARNVKRLEALIAFAQRRGTTLRGIMAALGLPSDDEAA